MLQSTDAKTRTLLELADRIEQREDFDMSGWCGCISGTAAEMLGIDHLGEGVGLALGLSLEQEHDLFLGVAGSTERHIGVRPPLTTDDTMTHDEYHRFVDEFRAAVPRERAARVVRHLAITDEVDWSIK